MELQGYPIFKQTHFRPKLGIPAAQLVNCEFVYVSDGMNIYFILSQCPLMYP